MQKLYPLKFTEIFKEKVWGGNRLESLLYKNFSPLDNCGESWELSSVQGEVSEVKNGFLKGNDIRELAEIYMGDLVGDKIFNRFGLDFPLLIKFLDTSDYLSVQVHPDDNIARKRHNSPGKTEMWYILDAQPGAEIIVGFKKEVSREEFLEHLNNKTLREILNVEKVRPGQVFHLPAGRIHAIGAGVTLCEIQQSSDVTYRIYDWDRPGMDGKPRELHIDQALDVMEYATLPRYDIPYDTAQNKQVGLVKSDFFTTNLLWFDKPIELDYFFLDSFVAYVCIDGRCTLNYPSGSESISKGELVLLPAMIKEVALVPHENCRMLETYIH